MVLSKLVCTEFWNKTITETQISRKDLLGDMLFIIELLQFDFVFIKPCDSSDNILDSVLRQFEVEEIIIVETVCKKKYIFFTLLITVLLYVINFYFIVTRRREKKPKYSKTF